MKKRTKLILKIGGSLCLIGLCLTGIGIAAGGKEYVLSADLNKLDGSATNGREKVLEEKIELDELQTIDVDLDNYDFEVQTSEDGTYYLYYSLLSNGEKSPFSCEVKDGAMKLRESRESYVIQLADIDFLINVFGGDTTRKAAEEKFILYVPENSELAACKIDVSDHNLYLNGLNCDDIEIDLDYGNLSTVDCSFNGGSVYVSDGDMEGKGITLADTEVSLNYGDMYLDESSLSNLKIQKSDGNLNADDLEALGNVTIESCYGDVSIRLKEEQKDKVSLNLKVSYGRINMDDSFSGAGLSLGDDENCFEYNAPEMKGLLKMDISDGDAEIEVE